MSLVRIQQRNREFLRKRFAWHPVKLYNTGEWTWWTHVYHRRVFTGETVGLLEPPPVTSEYYDIDEAAIMRLRGERFA